MIASGTKIIEHDALVVTILIQFSASETGAENPVFEHMNWRRVENEMRKRIDVTRKLRLVFLLSPFSCFYELGIFHFISKLHLSCIETRVNEV